MTLAEQISNDMSTYFDTDALAESGTLNSGSVTVVVEDEGVAEMDGGEFQFLDVCFQVADYATITYKSDTFVLRGYTWRYPKLRWEDAYTKTVRFRKSELPAEYK